MATGTGVRILRRLNLSDASFEERIVFSLAIGLAFVAYGILALGLLHLLSLTPILILLLGFLALGGGPSAALLREGIAHRKARSGSSSSRLLAVCTGSALALLLLLALVAGLAPPSGSDWDGLSYHLADPAIYLRHGGIVPLFWESHSNFPFTVEMLFTLALVFKSPGAAHTIHWLYLLVLCLTLASMWRRLWPDAPDSARWLAPLILCSAPLVLWSATVAYIDLALAAYDLLALYGLILWARTGKRGWLWASGLCLGFALGTKMTAALQAALLAPLVLTIGLRLKESIGTALRRALGWGILAAAVGAPWYIKSYIYTGNPVYPFFYNLFPHTRHWNAAIAAVYAHHQASDFGFGHGWRRLLMAPWNLVEYADRFTDGQPHFALLFGAMGPVFLALAPAVLILRRRDVLAAAGLLFAVIYGIVWFHMSQQARHLIPVLSLLALVGARGLNGLAMERRMARAPAYGIVGMQAVQAFLTAGLLVAPVWPVLIGHQEPRDYLRTTLDVYPVYEYINERLPREARILLIHEVRGFYLEREYLWGNEGHHADIPWSKFADEKEMRRFLREKLGVTHVLVNHRIAPREMRPMGWERFLWEAIHAGTLEPVYEERGFCLYFVKPFLIPIPRLLDEGRTRKGGIPTCWLATKQSMMSICSTRSHTRVKTDLITYHLT